MAPTRSSGATRSRRADGRRTGSASSGPADSGGHRRRRVDRLLHLLPVPPDRHAVAGDEVAIGVADAVLVAVRLQVIPHLDVVARAVAEAGNLDHQPFLP